MGATPLYNDLEIFIFFPPHVLKKNPIVFRSDNSSPCEMYSVYWDFAFKCPDKSMAMFCPFGSLPSLRECSLFVYHFYSFHTSISSFRIRFMQLTRDVDVDYHWQAIRWQLPRGINVTAAKAAVPKKVRKIGREKEQEERGRTALQVSQVILLYLYQISGLPLPKVTMGLKKRLQIWD